MAARWFVQRFNGKPLVTRIEGGTAVATADGETWRSAPSQLGIINAGEVADEITEAEVRHVFAHHPV